MKNDTQNEYQNDLYLHVMTNILQMLSLVTKISSVMSQ